MASIVVIVVIVQLGVGVTVIVAIANVDSDGGSSEEGSSNDSHYFAVKFILLIRFTIFCLKQAFKRFFLKGVVSSKINGLISQPAK